jgi:DNA polymerase III delta subunit
LPRSSKESDAGAEGSEQPTSGTLGLRELLAAVPESNCLVLLEPSLLAPPPALKSSGAAVTVISGAPPRGKELLAWIHERAVQAESAISSRAAQYFITQLYPQSWDRKPNNPRYDDPPDMALIATEIEKLATAAHPGSIEEDHIRALTPSRPDQRIFLFIDAAVGGNVRTALTEFQRLESGGEEPAQLVAQTLGQVELATLVARAGPRRADEVAQDVGSIQPSRVAAVMSSSRGRGAQFTLSAADAVGIDRRLKSGRSRHPVDAIYDLMLTETKSVSDDRRHTGRQAD